jgi:hypothetical protein
MEDFSINQIVKGRVCGTFVILGFRSAGREQLVILKEVNPEDYTQVNPGELHMTVDVIRPIY